MANLVEVVDLQRAIRAVAFKKAAELYSEKNISRWGLTKPLDTQIRGVFRLGYSELKKRHKKTKWMQDKYKPAWISRLDYFAARGGKPIMAELLDIIQELGGFHTDVFIRSKPRFQNNIPMPENQDEYGVIK